MSIATVLRIILLLLLIGAIPAWPHARKGGAARIRSRGGRTLQVQYRALPYRQVPAEAGINMLNKLLSDIPL
jgi:hypothetical protein